MTGHVEQHQWQVVVTVPCGQLSLANQRAWLDVIVTGKIENELVLRRALVGELDSAYFYITGVCGRRGSWAVPPRTWNMELHQWFQ